MTKNKDLQARRNEILEYLLNFGPFGVPTGTRKEFAEKWNCSVRTIEGDINYVTLHTKIPKMAKLGQKFLMGYEKTMKVVAQMLQDEDISVRAKGVALFNQTQDHYTKMCEKYGFKEIIADKIELEEKPTHTTLSKEECEAEIKRLLGK